MSCTGKSINPQPRAWDDSRRLRAIQCRRGMTILNGCRRSGGSLVAWLTFIFAFGMILSSSGAAAGTSTNLFRVGFSASTFSDVNENDAMAAVKIWAHTIAKERNIPFEPSPRILNGTKAIRQALDDHDVDAVALPVDEFWILRDVMDTQVFIVNANEGRITEEYVLLVHQDSGITQLEDLRGRSLAFFQNARMSLASVWLDTVLVQAGLPRTSEFSRITQAPKLAKALLPVFFRQVDACVVTRRGFRTMNELNPQIGQQLKVLATSPELVPTGFGFRRDYNDPLRETIIAELSQLIASPAGMQVQTLFQTGSLESHPISCLDSAFELLATHEQLFGETNTGTASKAMVAARGGVK